MSLLPHEAGLNDEASILEINYSRTSTTEPFRYQAIWWEKMCGPTELGWELHVKDTRFLKFAGEQGNSYEINIDEVIPHEDAHGNLVSEFTDVYWVLVPEEKAMRKFSVKRRVTVKSFIFNITDRDSEDRDLETYRYSWRSCFKNPSFVPQSN